jgi:hypothetical protein
MIAYAPTLTPGPRRAPESTIAVEWTSAPGPAFVLSMLASVIEAASPLTGP